MNEKHQVRLLHGASFQPPQDETVALQMKVVCTGKLRGCQMTRWAGDELQEVKTLAWTQGQLNASTLYELEAVVVDQLRLALLAIEGVQADLWEALLDVRNPSEALPGAEG